MVLKRVDSTVGDFLKPLTEPVVKVLEGALNCAEKCAQTGDCNCTLPWNW
jgi:hypothetical protein